MRNSVQQKLFSSVVGSAIATLGSITITSQSAMAANLVPWNYTLDSFNDGYSYGQLGSSSAFEIYGMAYRQVGNRLSIAINANMPLGGVYDGGAVDRNITYGDLFFNFTGQSFNAANSAGQLFGVRFAANNNAGVAGTGLFGGVTAKSVAVANNGFSSLTSYKNSVQSVGGSVSYGSLPADTTYFDQHASVLNVISSGTKLADITGLTATDLSDLDFAAQGANGTQTFGFSLDRRALPTGSFIANLFIECANDGTAINGETRDVPEPSAALGIVAVGLIFGGGKLRQRLKGNAVAAM